MAQCGCGHTKNGEGNCDGTHLTLNSEKKDEQKKESDK